MAQGANPRHPEGLCGPANAPGFPTTDSKGPIMSRTETGDDAIKIHSNTLLDDVDSDVDVVIGDLGVSRYDVSNGRHQR